MEVRAVAKYIRVQPRKVRIIADEIRGKNAGQAAALLHHHTSKGAKTLRKVLISAMANAAENHGLAPETLKIATIMVDQGPVLKRMTAKAMGRGARIIKKTSHITVVVEDVEPEVRVQPHGTNAKARPLFPPAFQKQIPPAKRANRTSLSLFEERPVLKVRFRSTLERQLILNEKAEILVNVGSEDHVSANEVVPMKRAKVGPQTKEGGTPVVISVTSPQCDFETTTAELIIPHKGESKVLAFGFVPSKLGNIDLDVVMFRKDTLRLLQHIVIKESVVEAHR